MNAPTPDNEQLRLEALKRYEILDTPTDQLFDDLVILASAICGTSMATVTFIDETRQWFKASVGLESRESPREISFCAHTICGSEPLIVRDATKDDRFADNPLVLSAPYLRFYAGAPMTDKDGFTLGSLCVLDTQPREIGAGQIGLLKILARQTMAHLECRQTARMLAESLSRIKLLHGMLPICAHCKKIRNDSGYWENVENYIRTRTETEFSHGICPACVREHYAEFADPLPENEPTKI